MSLARLLARMPVLHAEFRALTFARGMAGPPPGYALPDSIKLLRRQRAHKWAVRALDRG